MEQLIIIKKYFPDLTENQLNQFSMLPSLYKLWNDKINVISRKDIDHLMLHHVLHSLAIAKFILFQKNSDVLDIGTGGGFPGIPLAICFPETNFTLVDSIGKKIKVVDAISNSIGLKNLVVQNERAENLRTKFDFIVSRATASLSDLKLWSLGKIKSKNLHAVKNGIICLKGGNLEEELHPFINQVNLHPVNQYFIETFFETKQLIYLQMS